MCGYCHRDQCSLEKQRWLYKGFCNFCADGGVDGGGGGVDGGVGGGFPILSY